MNQNPLLPPGMVSAADVQRILTQLQADQQKFAQDLASLQQASQQQPQGGAPSSDCKKQPFSYSVEIALPTGANARTPGTFTVSQDGPFVALALQAAWRETQGAYAGRWLPPSSLEMYIRSVAMFNFAAAPRPDPCDFEFEISDGNSDRNWQDKPIPSSFLYSVGGQPAYLPVPGEFATNSTVTVAVTPIRPVTSQGILKVTFWGYKKLGVKGA